MNRDFNFKFNKILILLILLCLLLLIYQFKYKSYYLVDGGIKNPKIDSILIISEAGNHNPQIIGKLSNEEQAKILMNILPYGYKKKIAFKPRDVENIKINIRGLDSKGNEVLINCTYYETGEIIIDYKGANNKFKGGIYHVKNLDAREIYDDIREICFKVIKGDENER